MRIVNYVCLGLAVIGLMLFGAISIYKHSTYDAVWMIFFVMLADRLTEKL